jgi:hypothetical protein
MTLYSVTILPKYYIYVHCLVGYCAVDFGRSISALQSGLLASSFYLEDGGSRLLRIVGTDILNYMAPHQNQ